MECLRRFNDVGDSIYADGFEVLQQLIVSCLVWYGKAVYDKSMACGQTEVIVTTPLPRCVG
eukprot:835725-Pleurochrysis_carterae.AAC.2